MILPTIHLNGTSPEVLFEAYSDMANALASAIQQMEALPFNARDYYPQEIGSSSPTVWNQAVAEMRERIVSLRGVHAEISAIRDSIQSDIDARWKARQP